MVDTAGFDAGIKKVLSSLNQVKNAMRGMGSIGVKVSSDLNRTKTSLDHVDTSAKKASRGVKGFTMETAGGIRVFGSGGAFLKALAIVRNHLLLLSFAFGGIVATFKKFVDQARDTEMALMGVKSVAEGMGYSVKSVESLVKKFSNTGLLTIQEAAQSIKMLISMQGMNLDLVDKTMQAAMDWAAFNRLGQYSFGEAIAVFTRGLKEQRSQVTDAIGWVTNLDNAWKRYAASIGKTVGQLTIAEKNIGGVTIFLQESSVVAGDAEKVSNTFGGTLSKLNVVISNLSRAMGDVFLPVLSPIIDKLIKLVKATEEYFYINKELIGLKVDKFFAGIKNEFTEAYNIIKPFTASLWDNKEALESIASSAIQVGIAYKGLKGVLALLTGKGPSVGGAIAAGAATIWAGLKFFSADKQNAIFIKNVKSEVEALKNAYGPLTEEQNKMIASYDRLVKTTTPEALANQAAYVKGLEVESTKQATILKERIKALELLDRSNGLNKEQKSLLDSYNKQLTDINVSLGNYEYQLKNINHARFIADINKETEALGGLNRIISQEMILGIESFTAMSQNSQAKLIAGLRSFVSTAKQEYIPTIQKIITFLLNEMPKVNKVPLLDEEESKKSTEKLDRWLELLQKIKNETKEFYAIRLENVKLDALTQVQQWRNVAEEAGTGIKGLAEAEAAFDAYVAGRIFKAQREEMQKSVKIIYEYAKAWEAVQSAVTKGRVAGRQEGLGLLEDIIGKSAESKFTDYQRSVQDVIRTQYALNDAFKEGKITALEFANGIKELDYQLEVLRRRNLVDTATQFQDMFSQLGDAWIEVQFNIKREERETIDQLRKELERGTIDQLEYTARVAHAHEVAAVRTKNAWNAAGRGIAESMFNYLSQIVTQTYIAQRSISAALGAAFNPAAILLGLGMAVIGTAVTAGANKAMPNYSEPSYQDIYPGGASAEQRKRYGSLAQAPIQYITITPTVSIDGNQVWIAAGSVESFEAEVSDLMKQTMQAAIDNQEIDLSGVNPR